MQVEISVCAMFINIVLFLSESYFKALMIVRIVRVLYQDVLIKGLDCCVN